MVASPLEMAEIQFHQSLPPYRTGGHFLGFIDSLRAITEVAFACKGGVLWDLRIEGLKALADGTENYATTL